MKHGSVKVKYIEINNPVLLSNGVIELVEAKNKNGKIKKHIISTLRDGGAADELQRTTIAGRNSGSDLNEDLEREHIEEAPFLGYDKDGNLALATIDNSEKAKKILKNSINYFLENKYLKIGDDNYEAVKKMFERNFPGIQYENLGVELKNIIENDRIFTYSTEEVNDFEGLEGEMKEISLGGSNGKYFVYFDKGNNTIEYRLLTTITGFNDGFKKLSNKPSKFYTESENQYSKASRIENAIEGYVQTVKYFSEKIEKILLMQEFPIKNIRSKKIIDFLNKNDGLVNISPRHKKAIVNFLIDSNILKEYIPEKYVNTRYYNNGVREYKNNDVLFENQKGELLLDNFKANFIKKGKGIELELCFFIDMIDNGAPQTYTYSYKYIINI